MDNFEKFMVALMMDLKDEEINNANNFFSEYFFV